MLNGFITPHSSPLYTKLSKTNMLNDIILPSNLPGITADHEVKTLEDGWVTLSELRGKPSQNPVVATAVLAGDFTYGEVILYLPREYYGTVASYQSEHVSQVLLGSRSTPPPARAAHDGSINEQLLDSFLNLTFPQPVYEIYEGLVYLISTDHGQLLVRRKNKVSVYVTPKIILND